jgi:hypothetical protein
MKINHKTFEITHPGRAGRIALAIGIVGLVASAGGYFVDSRQFFFSWLTAFVFWLTLGLGGLFFVMLHHLVDAKWSVVLRRIAENLMRATPIMVIFFVPLAFGLHELYHWTHADAVANDPLLQSKAPYLNTWFFGIRTVFYFAVWSYLCVTLYRRSITQDRKGHDQGMTARFRRISAPGMLLFAVTVTFASFDWLMSLDAHWYSTIFGAYVFSGLFLGSLAMITLIVMYLRRSGQLTDVITVEHYHDLGKLMFAFLIFWSYMAFSQYFLQWYANIPEETIWYRHRWEGGWKAISLVIVFGHFVIPFFLMLTRAAKRSPAVLTCLGLWLLAVHFIDIHWLVLPNLHQHSAHPSWMDLSTLAGIGGVFLWYLHRVFVSSKVIAVNDPGLEASVKFTNN